MKNNNNLKNGYNIRSKFWQDAATHKKSMPNLPPHLFDIVIGCLLGDACMYRVSKDTKVKFEQGYIHEEYLFHLFNLFKDYTFHEEPYTRHEIRGPRKGLIKSYSFRTFTHTTFNPFWELFMNDKNKKIIRPNLVSNYLTAEGLAYWIMDDGSLNNRTMIIHTQSYSQEEVMISRPAGVIKSSTLILE